MLSTHLFAIKIAVSSAYYISLLLTASNRSVTLKWFKVLTPVEYHMKYLHVMIEFQIHSLIVGDLINKKVSEYDQEIPQSHTADQPTAPQGKATEQ